MRGSTPIDCVNDTVEAGLRKVHETAEREWRRKKSCHYRREKIGLTDVYKDGNRSKNTTITHIVSWMRVQLVQGQYEHIEH